MCNACVEIYARNRLVEGALNSALGELASPSGSEAKERIDLGHVHSPGT